MNKNGQKIFDFFFWQGEEEVCIDAQLKGLVELERRCRNTMQEVQILSERQEILKSTMEDKLRLQSGATERCHDQIFEEIKELEERNQKKLHKIVRTKYN